MLISFLDKLTTYFFVVFILILLNSCAFIELQQDLDKLNEKGTIYGRVVYPENDLSSNIIVVFDSNSKVVAYQLMHPKDFYYVFMLPPDKEYRIFAYNDIDKDKIYDKTEPVGKWLNLKKITVKPGGVFLVPDIIINKNDTIPSQYAAIIGEASKKQSNNMIIRAGVIADSVGTAVLLKNVKLLLKSIFVVI